MKSFHFRRNQSDTTFANAWQASRIVRDLGEAAPAPKPTTPTA